MRQNRGICRRGAPASLLLAAGRLNSTLADRASCGPCRPGDLGGCRLRLRRHQRVALEQAAEFLGTERPAEIVALALAAALALEPGELPRGLDAFRGRPDAEFASETDDGPHDRGGVAALFQLVHECTVDLD